MIPTEAQCLSILEREGAPEQVVAHCKAVTAFVRELADRAALKLKVDKPALIAAALLHDVGRSKTHGAEHGAVGAQIARSYGADDSVCRMIERHVGSGLDDAEAARLGLPAGRIYVPLTIEEKILCYADKHLFGEKRVSSGEATAAFKDDIGEGPAFDRLTKLMAEVSALCS